MSEKQIDKEISATKQWGIGIILTIIIQSLGVVWWASSLDKQVSQNAQDILNLKEGSSIILTREQLDDILGSRDARLTNIEAAVIRIEGKIDRGQ